MATRMPVPTHANPPDVPAWLVPFLRQQADAEAARVASDAALVAFVRRLVRCTKHAYTFAAAERAQSILENVRPVRIVHCACGAYHLEQRAERRAG